MKIRYGIATITVLLFLLAVKNSFGQRAKSTGKLVYNMNWSE